MSTICRNDIAPIYLEQTHGDIKAQDIYFDYAILSLSLALLRLRDTNSDGIIGSDDFYFEIVKSSDRNYTFNLLDVLDYLKDSNNQKSFNRTLLGTVGHVADGFSSLLKVIGNDTTYFNQTDLTNLLDNVSAAANRYQIDDDIDNDEDGFIDEEILNGIDDDGDGWIDEDVGIVL